MVVGQIFACGNLIFILEHALSQRRDLLTIFATGRFDMILLKSHQSVFSHTFMLCEPRGVNEFFTDFREGKSVNNLEELLLLFFFFFLRPC